MITINQLSIGMIIHIQMNTHHHLVIFITRVIHMPKLQQLHPGTTRTIDIIIPNMLQEALITM